jgi:hypothetical protein
MTPKPNTVHTLVLRGPSDAACHVTVAADGVMTTGTLGQTFPKAAFVIQVATPTDREAWQHSLARIVRNCLSAYPITVIEDGGGLPMDLKAWLREHRQAV